MTRDPHGRIPGQWEVPTMARDYSKSKYQNAVAEWASSIAMDGCSPTAGDVESGGWYALVTLDYGTGDAEVIAAATDGVPALFQGAAVIIREDSQGFVWADYGPVHPVADPAAWRALMTAWGDIENATAAWEDDNA